MIVHNFNLKIKKEAVCKKKLSIAATCELNYPEPVAKEVIDEDDKQHLWITIKLHEADKGFLEDNYVTIFEDENVGYSDFYFEGWHSPIELRTGVAQEGGCPEGCPPLFDLYIK